MKEKTMRTTDELPEIADAVKRLVSIWDLRTTNPARYASAATAKEASALLDMIHATQAGTAALAAARAARRRARAEAA
jgi:hypothetical protein